MLLDLCNMLKISIIITVYNRLTLLEKALISLRFQSVEPYELIISDDGSDEDVESLISKFANSVSFPVIYIKQKNKGF